MPIGSNTAFYIGPRIVEQASQPAPTGISYFAIFMDGNFRTTWHCYDYTDGTAGSLIDTVTGTGISQTSAGRLNSGGRVRNNEIYWSDTTTHATRWNPAGSTLTRTNIQKNAGYIISIPCFTDGTYVWYVGTDAAVDEVTLSRIDVASWSSVTHSAAVVSTSPTNPTVNAVWEDSTNVYVLHNNADIITLPKDMTAGSIDVGGWAGGSVVTYNGFDDLLAFVPSGTNPLVQKVQSAAITAVWPGWDNSAYTASGRVQPVSTTHCAIPLFDSTGAIGGGTPDGMTELWLDARSGSFGDAPASIITPDTQLINSVTVTPWAMLEDRT